MKLIRKWVLPLMCTMLIVAFLFSACNLANYAKNAKPVDEINDPMLDNDGMENLPVESVPDVPGNPAPAGGLMDIKEEPASPGAPILGLNSFDSNLPNKPVGFINTGSINATVQPWSYIPLGGQEFQPPPSASTVASASGSGGDSPNTSSYLELPLGTYTWCIDWEDEDKDEDGYFDYYHYIETATTLLDENDSDDLDFAEIVMVNTPPEKAFVYKGKCGFPSLKEDCTGKATYFKSFVGNVLMEPVYPLDVRVYANTAYPPNPAGIKISASNPEYTYYEHVILEGSGHWIEATTSDPYSAIGVSIFGDETIGWARILFDGVTIWEGDTSECVIDPDENSGLGWYGLYAEAVCVTPGTHTVRVESGPTKEGVGGWQGGVPVLLFGFRW